MVDQSRHSGEIIELTIGVKKRCRLLLKTFFEPCHTKHWPFDNPKFRYGVVFPSHIGNHLA